MLCLGLSSTRPNEVKFFWFGFICIAAWCYVCYCAVLKSAGVVIILSVTLGSSPCLCSCVVDQSVYVNIYILCDLFLNSGVKTFTLNYS
jgi:hypothetical protein